MKLVKRCNDNVIALSIILVALDIRFAFQKIILVIDLHLRTTSTSEIPGIH